MVRHFVVALFSISIANVALAACPATVDVWHGSTTGKAFLSHKINLHEWFIFSAPTGSVWNDQVYVPTPKFTLSTPLSSSRDLSRLAHSDWLKVSEYRRESFEKAKGVPDTYSTYEQEVSQKEADVLTTRNFDKVIDCFLAQSKKPQDVHGAKSEDKGRPGSPVVDASDISERDKEMIGELDAYIAQGENVNIFKNNHAIVSHSAPKKGGDSRIAKIINRNCAKFTDWGTGVTSDVKKFVNSCKVPIAVTYCFVDPGVNGQCYDTNPQGWGTTNIIPVRGRALVVSAARGTRFTVKYYICDMSDASRPFCLKP